MSQPTYDIAIADRLPAIPTIHTLCEQLGRWFVSESSAALEFAELDGNDRPGAAVFAAELPPVPEAMPGGQRSQPARAGVAIALVPSASPLDASDEITRRMGVSVLCEARTNRQAVGTLEALLRVLRPDERSPELPRWNSSLSADDTTGIRGTPPHWLIGPEGAGVWRIIAIDAAGSPAVLPAPASGAQGHRAQAIVEIQVLAAAACLKASELALTVRRTQAGATGSVLIEQRPASRTASQRRRLVLSGGASLVSIDLAGIGSVEDVIDTINDDHGDDWTAEAGAAGTSIRAAHDLLPFQASACTGGEDGVGVPIGVLATPIV